MLRVVAVRPPLARPAGGGPLLDRKLGRERVFGASVVVRVFARVLFWLLLVVGLPVVHQPLFKADLASLWRVLLLQARVGPLARVARAQLVHPPGVGQVVLGVVLGVVLSLPLLALPLRPLVHELLDRLWHRPVAVVRVLGLELPLAELARRPLPYHRVPARRE